jgi:hypothetical protein
VLGDPENRAVHARSPSLATTGRQRRCRGRSGLIGKPGSRQQIDTPVLGPQAVLATHYGRPAFPARLSLAATQAPMTSTTNPMPDRAAGRLLQYIFSDVIYDGVDLVGLRGQRFRNSLFIYTRIVSAQHAAFATTDACS